MNDPGDVTDFRCDPCECGGACDDCKCRRDEDGPSDDELFNRPGVEGGIAYDLSYDLPGNNYLGEHDPRL